MSQVSLLVLFFLTVVQPMLFSQKIWHLAAVMMKSCVDEKWPGISESLSSLDDEFVRTAGLSLSELTDYFAKLYA